MDQPRYWKQLQQHPLPADDYKDISGEEWKAFLADVKEHGVINNRRIALFDGKVIDGWQLQRACVQLEIRPNYYNLHLPPGMTIEKWVKIVQENRRHETPEVIGKRANERQARILSAREKGESIRAIADAEDVSTTTVKRDLAEGAAPTQQGAPRSPAKVTGKDGKTYPGKSMADKLAARLKRQQAAVAPTEKVDDYRTPLPNRCVDAYCDPWIQEAIDFLSVAVTQFWEKRLADGLDKRKKHYPFFNAKDFADGCAMVGNTMEQLLTHLKDFRPSGVCPGCAGSGCGECHTTGLVPRDRYKKLKEKKK